MKTIKHACKYCQREVTLKIQEGAEDLFKVDWWTARAACNQCSDFHNRRLDLRDMIYRQIDRLERIQACNNIKRHGESEDEFEDVEKKMSRDDQKLAAGIESVRRRLNYLTRCYAKRICDRENRVFSWEPSFVDTLMKKPEFTPTYLDGYFENFAPTAYAQWMAAKEKDAKMRAPSGDSSGTSRR